VPTDPPRFAPGRLILHRNVGPRPVGWVRPARVVSDDERGLLLWVAPGSPVVTVVATDGRGMRAMPFAEWVTLESRPDFQNWNGPGLLKFHPPGEAHSVWWFRSPQGAFTGWYVNLEEPAIRWDDGDVAGIDVVDQDLDILVSPDRSWSWKDEDEFTERLGFPEHYWVRDEAAVRAEGERVVKQIEAGQFPFDGTWTDFVPDPSWRVPSTLPAGWDRPPVPR
jgi:predicted RNA-binding protein associated with RNAse of E/G family